MGFYIETGSNRNKALSLVNDHNAKIITVEEAKTFIEKEGVICVVTNHLFEAAAFCHSLSEYEAFTQTSDDRPKTWLIMDRDKAEKLSGFICHEKQETSN